VAQYPGPPISSAPDPAWRPDVVEPYDPPRALPAQDHAAMDTAERAARRFTYLVGLIAGVTLALIVIIRLYAAR
jgi:hypothetical protein